jgi:hypothetical protein
MPHIQKPNTETVQIIEQQWSTRLNRGSAQRDGSGTPSSTVEWQPLYPTLRVPGSNPQSLPELKAYHGLGRIELPGRAARRRRSPHPLGHAQPRACHCARRARTPAPATPTRLLLLRRRWLLLLLRRRAVRRPAHGWRGD